MKQSHQASLVMSLNTYSTVENSLETYLTNGAAVNESFLPLPFSFEFSKK